MKRLYLFLAVAGAILPYAFFTQHFLSQGVGLYTFVAALFVNPAAGGFTADLLFTSVVFWIFMFSTEKQGKRSNSHSFHCNQPANWAFMRCPGLSLC